MWTLSALQMHPHSMVVCDEDATLELQVKTVKVRARNMMYHPPINLLKYFKSIEVVASKLGFTQAIPIAVQKRTSIPEDDKCEKSLERDIIEQNDTARQELAAISQKQELAPPSTPLPRAVTPELTPDSMASRIPEFPERTQRLFVSDDLILDRMSGRIGSPVVV